MNMDKLSKWIQNSSIRKLIGLSFALAFVIIFVGVVLSYYLFDGDPPEIYVDLTLTLFAIVCSFVGFSQILKKEAPAPLGKTRKGFFPVLGGSLWVLLCLLSIIYGVFH